MRSRRGIVKPPKPMSKGEEALALHLRAEKIPFEREYRFHPKRRWKIDFCLVEHRIGIEVEGGVWTAGRHTRASGFVADCAKYNAAAKLGFRVLRYETSMVLRGDAINDIMEIIKEGK